jgi:hypothetical protein
VTGGERLARQAFDHAHPHGRASGGGLVLVIDAQFENAALLQQGEDGAGQWLWRGPLSDLIAACAPLFRGKFHPRWLIKQRENSEGDPF